MGTSYLVKLETGQVLNFNVHDRRNVDLTEMSAYIDVPDWAKLEHHQCSICPFDTGYTKFCPAGYYYQATMKQTFEVVFIRKQKQ